MTPLFRFPSEKEGSPRLPWLSGCDHRVSTVPMTAIRAVVAIGNAEGAEPAVLERLFAEEVDVRTDPAVGNNILRFAREQAPKQSSWRTGSSAARMKRARLPRRTG